MDQRIKIAKEKIVKITEHLKKKNEKQRAELRKKLLKKREEVESG